LEVTTKDPLPSSLDGATPSTGSVVRTGTDNPIPMAESTLPQAHPASLGENALVANKMSLPAVSTFPIPTAPQNSMSSKPPLQPIRHRKPLTISESFKWERDASVKDYVHRKDTVHCNQCKAGEHNGIKDPEDLPEGGILLHYSKYQKEPDTQINPPPRPANGTTSKQAATLTNSAPQYIRVDKPRKFFQKGRIFKTVWFEPFGEFSASARARPAELAYHDSCPDYNDLGEKPYGRFRWFVVIRKHLNHSLCFAIVNGGAKSIAKNRARGEHLAVLYSTNVRPPKADEEEGIVFDPIAVIMEEGKQNISPLARLDFSRVYTVEHDLKVMKIGRVHPDSHSKLDDYYKKTCFDEPEKPAQSNGN
ncbi:hypothetical protein B0T20DRAFT_501438, partial [Sordaria brevicollis]